MKYLILALFITQITACGTTRLARTDVEYCSLRGDGYFPGEISSTSGTASTYAQSGKTWGTANTNLNSNSIMCVPPKDKYQKCIANELQKSAKIVNKYNDGSSTREAWTALGYLWILPGIGGMVYNNSYNEEVSSEVNKIREDARNKCKEYVSIALKN